MKPAKGGWELKRAEGPAGQACTLRRRRELVGLAGLAAIALALGGCAAAPEVRFYTLGGAPVPAAGVDPGAPEAPGYTIALGPVTVPDMVDRPQLVVRGGPNRVAVLEQQRWAEPLKAAIARAIAANLGALLPGATVALRTDNANREAKYRLLADVVRFESEPGKEALLEVVWSLRPTAGDAAPLKGKMLVREATRGDGYDELAAAHGRAVAGVCEPMAKAVRQLEGGKAAP